MFKLCCQVQFLHAFTALQCVFKVLTLVGQNKISTSRMQQNAENASVNVSLVLSHIKSQVFKRYFREWYIVSVVTKAIMWSLFYWQLIFQTKLHFNWFRTAILTKWIKQLWKYALRLFLCTCKFSIINTKKIIFGIVES